MTLMPFSSLNRCPVLPSDSTCVVRLCDQHSSCSGYPSHARDLGCGPPSYLQHFFGQENEGKRGRWGERWDRKRARGKARMQERARCSPLHRMAAERARRSRPSKRRLC